MRHSLLQGFAVRRAGRAGPVPVWEPHNDEKAATPVRDNVPGELDAFLISRIPGAAGDGSDGERESLDPPQNLWRSGRASGVELAEALAEFFALPRGAAEDIGRRPHAMGDLSRRYLREAFAYPFLDEGRASLALADPSQKQVLDAVALALGARPTLYILSFDEIDQLFEQSTEAFVVEASPLPSEPDAGARIAETAESLQDLARGAPIVRITDQILERAVELGATDIHLETDRDLLRVRYRIDGYLRRDQTIPLGMAAAVISRIKIISGLDIADRRLPQDGRANLRIGSVEADLRVAVMPTMFGENAVIRILLKDLRLLELERIGMKSADRGKFESLLAEPHGVIVVTGPTGSGKTTTLATAISMLNDPSKKIVTVEDPIEYQIPGVHQTQIKPAIGLTFAMALRSFLRHNPDVIMVGEMRDRETAGIGIQAALTGHLVLTTLHTNSASDAVVRLLDMGVEPYLLGASLRGILGQRLVRKLCDKCKEVDPRASLTASDLIESRGLAIVAPATVHVAKGCPACSQTGYRGRVGIFEVMRVDDKIRAQIHSETNSTAIFDLAREAGMTSMLEDGIGKCGEGLTSIEEILRATG